MKKNILFRFFLFLITLFVFHYNVFSENYIIISGPAVQQKTADSGYIGSDNICHWAGTSVSWYLNYHGAGDGLTFNQTKLAILPAYSEWDGVSTATISFNYIDETESPWLYDGLNVHYWAEQGDSIFKYIDSTNRAITVVSINQNEEFTDVDIVYNGRDWIWKVDGNSVDVQSLATHEIGHKIGLHHSDVDSTTMRKGAYTLYGTAIRTLELDDRKGVSFLYRGNLIDDESLTPTNSILDWNMTVYPNKTLTIPSGKTLNLNGYNLTNNGGTITKIGTGTINPEIVIVGEDDYYGKVSSALDNAGSGETVNVKSDACNETSSINVLSGRTLDIDAGVTIKMADDEQINVYGELYINGEDEDEVTITSVNLPAQADPGDWVGIVMQGGYLDAEYCWIKYADYGIQASSLAEIEMDYSEITHCNMGLYLNDSEAWLYHNKIKCSNDAFYLYNYSSLGLPDDYTKGYNKIYYDIELDYNCHGYWGVYNPYYAGYNAFYEEFGYGELLLDNYSDVWAQNNYWDENRTFYTYGASTLVYTPKLGSDPTKVPATNIADMEVEQLYREALRISSNEPEKSWLLLKDIIEEYPESKFANYSIARMKIISKKVEDNDFIPYLQSLIYNKHPLKQSALEISINQLIEKGIIQEALTNCFYLLANYPDIKIKNYILYQMFTIYLDYLDDSSNADRVLADLREIDAESKAKVLQFALNILDNYNNSKLDRKIGDITFSYPNYPADIEGYKETESEKMTAGIPKTFALHQNYPNPFNPVTTIKYDLPEATDVKITVYNVLGQEVATIINDNLNAGSHEMKWDASKYASGVYICRLEAGSYTKSIKLLLIK